MFVRLRSKLVPAAVLAAAFSVVALPGCGEPKEEFSQEFEPPPVPPTVVENPPDTGDDLHPRDR